MINITPDCEGIERFKQIAPEGPICMVNLLKFNGESGQALFQEYVQLSEQIIARLGFESEVVYWGEAGPDFSGGEDWDVVAIAKYSHFDDFARLMTDREYREKATPMRDKALAKAVLMVSTPAS